MKMFVKNEIGYAINYGYDSACSEGTLICKTEQEVKETKTLLLKCCWNVSEIYRKEYEYIPSRMYKLNGSNKLLH